MTLLVVNEKILIQRKNGSTCRQTSHFTTSVLSRSIVAGVFTLLVVTRLSEFASTRKSENRNAVALGLRRVTGSFLL